MFPMPKSSKVWKLPFCAMSVVAVLALLQLPYLLGWLKTQQSEVVGAVGRVCFTDL